MSPKKYWFQEFRRLLEKDGSILDLKLVRKHTVSWSYLNFYLTPADAAIELFEFVTAVNHLIEKKIIDRSQAHKYIHGRLMNVFYNQFDVYFNFPEPQSNTLTNVCPEEPQTTETITLNR